MESQIEIYCTMYHDYIHKLNEMKEEYDLGIIIIPKKNIDIFSKLPIIEEMKRICKKIGNSSIVQTISIKE